MVWDGGGQLREHAEPRATRNAVLAVNRQADGVAPANAVLSAACEQAAEHLHVAFIGGASMLDMVV